MAQPKLITEYLPFPPSSAEFKEEFLTLINFIKQKESKETIISQLSKLEELFKVDRVAASWFMHPTNLEYTIQRVTEYGANRAIIRLRNRIPNHKLAATMFVRAMKVAVGRIDVEVVPSDSK